MQDPSFGKRKKAKMTHNTLCVVAVAFSVLISLTPHGEACDPNITDTLNNQPRVPLRVDGSPGAYHWGRFLLYDLRDNGIIDASILYGTGDAALLPTGQYRLTPGLDRMPLMCAPGISARPTAVSLGGDTACCGSECSESPELLSIYVFLARIHNRYGRARVLSLLRDSCPGCYALHGNATAMNLLLAYYSSIAPAWSSGPVNGSPNPLESCPVFASKGGGVLSAFGRRVTTEMDGLCDDLYGLLTEQAGPDEEDVLGPLGRDFFVQTINASGPVWLFNGIADGVIDAACADYLASLDEAADNSGTRCACNTTEGSMIFFTVLFGAVVVILIVVAFIK